VISRGSCAVVFCAIVLLGSTVAPSFGDTTAASTVAAHVGGRCTDGSRYTFDLERVDGQLSVDFEVNRAPRGSRWRYRMYVRAAGTTYRDRGRMTAVFGYWAAHYVRLGRTGHRITVRVHGESRAGQVCSVNFSQSW
jgi:hypothetical protein